MTPPAPPGAAAGKPGRRGGVAGWVRAHKGPAVMVGATGAVAAYALYEKRKQGTAASSAAGTTASTTGTVTPGTYDSTAQDQYDALESQISNLQAMIGQSSTAAAGSGTTTAAPPASTTAPATPTGTAPVQYPAPASYSVTPYPSYADLGWGAIPGLPATELYHYQVLNAKGGIVSDQKTSALSARVQGLQARTPYFFRVSADPDGAWTTAKGFTTT